MERSIKSITLAGLVFFVVANINAMNLADVPTANREQMNHSGTDYVTLAEKCRLVAIRLDTVSRYQDRASCSSNLDGASVYVASREILEYQFVHAATLLSQAIMLTNFAIDVDCHGQDEMKRIALDLQFIRQSLLM